MTNKTEASTANEETDASIIIVGRVGSPFGVQGFLKIQSFTEPEENILNYQPWMLKIRGEWQEIEVNATENGEQIIAQFSKITDRDIARRYTNCEIGVSRSLFPPTAEGEYYWDDLIGLKAISPTGDTLGVITSIMETGSNDVLIIAGLNGEQAIPFLLDDVITEVNLQEGFIRVKWDFTE